MDSTEHRGAQHAPPPSLSGMNNNNNNSSDKNNNKTASANDHNLAQSINKLSISTSSPRRVSPSPQSAPTAQTHRGREGRRSSISPNARGTPCSPVARTHADYRSSEGRSSTPNLLRKASMNSLHSANGASSNRPASRRSSSNHYLSPTATRSPTGLFPAHIQAYEERPPLTPASVASAYLAKELELLHGDRPDQTAETVVILHDDCYGHRYSRPRASKGLLSTIVERPERIQASVLGVSMAYVRLGERHCEGKNPIHPDLDPKTLPSIPFRIHKTTRKVPLSSTAVTNVHGNKWMEELKMMCDSAEAKLALNGNELRRPDMNRGPDAEPLQNFHQGDLYLCSESLNAFEGALGAVCEAVDEVFSSTSSHKRAFVAVRPPGHHCSASFPSGFCWVNNVHVGIMHGILNHGLTHVAIIDFDLHHGDGSQAIAWQHNKRGLAKNAAAWKKTSIGYFSVHDINSYPCEYGDEEKVKNASLCIDNAHGQNIWNVHLQEWKSEVEFWTLYQSRYSILLDKTRNYLRLQTERLRASGQEPKAVIFLSAGFDASEWEGVGMQRHKVNVPTEFYARLTRDVVRIASEEGLSVDGRVISVLEGGYSDRALYAGVLSHLSGLAGVDAAAVKEEGASGLLRDVGSRVGSHSRRSTLNEADLKMLKICEFPYDPSWWSVGELDLFDAVRTTPPVQEAKKPRTIQPGNYSSPTQASNAKMTEVAKIRRNMSNQTTFPTTVLPRPPTPPTPEVPWATAAHELSKLLIPDNRQIDSCKHTELNNEATKTRKERQSLQIATDGASDNIPAAPSVPVTAAARAVAAGPTRKSLRERKPVSYLEEDDDYRSRRKTVGTTAVSSTVKGSTRGASLQLDSNQPRQASRRLSSISAITDLPTSSSTVANSRPDSSMSARTQTSTTLHVRKTRPAAPPRKDSGKTVRAPRKTKAAVSKPQPGVSSAAPQALPNANNGENLPSTKEGAMSGAATTAPVDDLDQITHGMKKIKINVLTKEQKAARLKAREEAAIAGNADDVVKAEGSAMGEPPLSRLVTEHLPGSENVKHEAVDETVSMMAREAPQQLEIGTSIPTTPTIISPTEPSLASTPYHDASNPPAGDGDGDLFIPYQPEGPPAYSIPIQQPVQILEPNTGTPVKANEQQQASRSLPPQPSFSVPVSPRGRGHGFTATSTIPFSPAPAQRSISGANVPFLPRPEVKKEDVDRDAREEQRSLPNSPARPQ